MAVTILFTALAAWGTWSLIWTVLGWLLPKVPMALVFCCPQGQHPDGAIARCGWLRSLGLFHGPLIIVGNIPEKEQEIWITRHSNVEFLMPEELSSRLELERTI